MVVQNFSHSVRSSRALLPSIVALLPSSAAFAAPLAGALHLAEHSRIVRLRLADLSCFTWRQARSSVVSRQSRTKVAAFLWAEMGSCGLMPTDSRQQRNSHSTASLEPPVSASRTSSSEALPPLLASTAWNTASLSRPPMPRRAKAPLNSCWLRLRLFETLLSSLENASCSDRWLCRSRRRNSTSTCRRLASEVRLAAFGRPLRPAAGFLHGEPLKGETLQPGPVRLCGDIVPKPGLQARLRLLRSVLHVPGEGLHGATEPVATQPLVEAGVQCTRGGGGDIALRATNLGGVEGSGGSAGCEADAWRPLALCVALAGRGCRLALRRRPLRCAGTLAAAALASSAVLAAT